MLPVNLRFMLLQAVTLLKVMTCYRDHHENPADWEGLGLLESGWAWFREKYAFWLPE